MALRSVELEELRGVDLIPQAVIGKPVSFFEKHLSLHFIDDCDDLDYYRGAAMCLDDKLSFALMHHRSDPPDTTTLYLFSPLQKGEGPGERLSREIHDLEQISKAIRAVVDELKIPLDLIHWQRSHGPAL
jgi:hypothetical protein